MSDKRPEPRYAGLCLGGPRDGQWLAAQHSSFQVPVTEPMQAWAGLDPQRITTKVSYETYLWHNFGDYGVWWWVDKDSTPATPPHLMRRLLDGYRKPVLLGD